MAGKPPTATNTTIAECRTAALLGSENVPKWRSRRNNIIIYTRRRFDNNFKYIKKKQRLILLLGIVLAESDKSTGRCNCLGRRHAIDQPEASRTARFGTV